MKIYYLGHSCFLIVLPDGRRIVIDPFSPKIGIPFPGVSADIVICSHDHLDHNAADLVQNCSERVLWGEHFEDGTLKITPFPCFHDKEKGLLRGLNTLYLIESDGLSALHLGDLGHLLDEELLGSLKNLDLLFAPIGGKVTLEPSEIFNVIHRLDPKIAVGMHYQVPGLKNVGLPGVLESAEHFLKLFPGTAFLSHLELPDAIEKRNNFPESEAPPTFLLQIQAGMEL